MAKRHAQAGSSTPPVAMRARHTRAEVGQTPRMRIKEPLIVDVVVEVPKGSRNKFEWDPGVGAMRLDRQLFTATRYPADYGFVVDTHGEDGDPLDALVLLGDPTFPGCHIFCRPVGVFWMSDEHGPDAKLLMVPSADSRVDWA